MAGDALNRSPAATDPAGDIAAYLTALDRALPGPPRARADIVDEIGDGLLAAAAGHRDRGATPAVAARAALAEFGSAHVVASAFAGELATARARRLLTELLLTGPLVGVWWALLLAPHRWPPQPDRLLAAIPVLPIVGVAVIAAGAVLASTGGHAHRLPRLSPRHALLSAGAVAAACAAADVTMLAVLGAATIAGATGHPPVLVTAAAAASLARLLWLGQSAHGCRRSALSLN